MTNLVSHKFWDDERIRAAASCRSNQLKDLAEAIGEDPITFFRTADFRGIDLRGQNLVGMDLSGARLDGAVVDETTQIDSRFADLLGYPSESALIDVFDEHSMPLFGRRELLAEIIDGIASGVQLTVISGAPGSGKTTLLREFSDVVQNGFSGSFKVTSRTRERFAAGPVILLWISGRMRDVENEILKALGDYRSGAEARSLFSTILQDDLFLKTFHPQLHLFSPDEDVFDQVRELNSIVQKRMFLNELFVRLRGRYPETKIIVILDDTDLFHRSASDLRSLSISLPQAQFIVSSRSHSAQLELEISDDTGQPVVYYNMEAPSYYEVRQLIDWIESRSGGALKIPVPAREETANLLRAQPRDIVAALRNFVAVSLLMERQLPIIYSVRGFLEASATSVRLLKLDNVLHRGDARGVMRATTFARLESFLNTKGGVSPVSVARLLQVNEKTAIRTLNRLVSIRALERSSGLYCLRGGLLWNARDALNRM
jgi:hypothetical protein